jgi:hypothetical protein
MYSGERVSIWFFIGGILLVYGILIVGAGIYGLFYPPAHKLVLSELHPAIWWGALLVVLGGFYCWHFFPGKQQKRAEAAKAEKKPVG